jgi:hypothetical protein
MAGWLARAVDLMATERGTSHLESLMQWAVGLLLITMLGRALAQETPSSNKELEREYVDNAYDQAVVKFNTDIKGFPSWEAFKTAVLPRISPETMGRCYERTGKAMTPTQITRVPFPGMQEDHWRQTSGNGWRTYREDGTFIEYRVNEAARLLLRIEGIKVWFFPVQTRQICEFPL